MVNTCVSALSQDKFVVPQYFGVTTQYYQCVAKAHDCDQYVPATLCACGKQQIGEVGPVVNQTQLVLRRKFQIGVRVVRIADCARLRLKRCCVVLANRMWQYIGRH